MYQEKWVESIDDLPEQIREKVEMDRKYFKLVSCKISTYKTSENETQRCYCIILEDEAFYKAHSIYTDENDGDICATHCQFPKDMISKAA